jgi:6-phosphogluconolactonase
MPPQSEIRVLNDAAGLFNAAVNEFALLASNAVNSKGSFCVALSGGSTPKTLYTLLASSQSPAIPWEQTCVFFGDERFVPPDHADSNFRMANDALLSKVPLRPENVFRVPTETGDADTAARRYEETMQNYFALSPGQFPRFDLILLGLGPDGHTASLFPDSAGLHENKRWVIANWVEKFKTNRITFTYPVIDNAACAAFLVSGNDKAEILREVLEVEPAGLPAQKVRPVDGKLLWLVDRAAAASLSLNQV